ncbi:hypothetical protein GCM10023191_028430 [Actinoallomurus oryzae]|uniref:Uncharacterized protein n=1 Tax=Actinoallomurus oryzae TaxID=502180 RepID=A0ABP8PUH9_9ACTN
MAQPGAGSAGSKPSDPAPVSSADMTPPNSSIEPGTEGMPGETRHREFQGITPLGKYKGPRRS